MFSTKRSDFGSTIAGYLLAAVMLIFAALQLFNSQFDMFDVSMDVPFRTIAMLCVIASAIALWKAYIIDGMTYMIIGLGAYAFITNVPMFLIVLAIAAIFTAVMSYRGGDVFVLSLNALVAVAFLLMAFTAKADFLADNPAIAGAFFLIAGLLAGYICFNDWSLFQDIVMDYEDEMFGDDDCCCGDDDCECGDDCECHCHDEECQCEEKEQ